MDTSLHTLFHLRFITQSFGSTHLRLLTASFHESKLTLFLLSVMLHDLETMANMMMMMMITIIQYCMIKERRFAY